MKRGLLLTGMLWLTAAALAPAADWTNWRGPKADGVSPETGLPSKWSPEGENLVWKAPYGSRSTPLVMKGRVYVLNYVAEQVKAANGELVDKAETIQERILCLDEATGKKIWEHNFNVFHTDIVTVRLGWTNMAADPATGYIYAHGTQGLFLCIDGTGPQPKVVWRKSLSEEYGRITGYGGRVTSPVVFEDLVLLGMMNSSWGDQAKGGNRFFAFDKKTGEVRWITEPGGQPKDTYYSVPVVANIAGQDLLISGGADGGVYAMKVRTGEVVWAYTFGTTAVNCSPVVDGNLIYIGHGEENADNNLQGRVVCVDGADVKDGKPKLVWQQDGVKARYTSPIVQGGRLYITDEAGKLFCFDGKTGEQAWKFSYGRNARGSPVYADGKIYVGEVNSKFHILEPGAKKCKSLSSTFFPSETTADVEINGSPAVANGRVFFATSEEMFCIGLKDAKSAETTTMNTKLADGGGPIGSIQLNPADVVVGPGQSVTFKVRQFQRGSDFGFADAEKCEWSLPQPPLPPGAKSQPPALDGQIKNGVLTVDAKKAAQQGYVMVKFGEFTAKARVRVAPVLPYVQDFSKIPDGAVPGGWVNAQGKFVVGTVDGVKVLKKVTDKASPLVARGNAYIGLPDLTDYTIEADVMGGQVGENLPDFGVVANRYVLMFQGNSQKLRVVSWDALPRVDNTIGYKVLPGVWYRMKLTVEIKGDRGMIRGKAWPREGAEPTEWSVSLDDPRPNREGSPALYGYVTGHVGPTPGTDIFYANVRVTPNKK